jgi:hypothetical protein
VPPPATKPEARSLAASTAQGNGATTSQPDSGKGTARLDIVIGLDFGTRFTKVGYRIVGVDQPRIIVLDPAKPETALFKSILFFDTQTMTVHRKRPSGNLLTIEELPYLKLLLKDFDQPTILVPLMLRKIVDPKSIKVFAAFYLAGVLNSAIATIAKTEAARLNGRRVFYALNVSLPADHYDDSASDRFREVGVVALRWAQGPIGTLVQASLSDLTASYEDNGREPVVEFDVCVFPEIIAALYQFITRRDTPDGIHGFIDIGGGTIDGCIFDLLRDRGQSIEVNILSAKVAPLGTIVVAKKALGVLYRDLEQRIETEIVTRNEIEIRVPLPLEAAAKQLADFTAQLLIDARGKMPGQALVHDKTAHFETSALLRELAKTFNIFVAGGGANSGWYKGVVAGVHQERSLTANNIMNYRCELLRPPPDFDTSAGIAFERFIIAYGLTMDAANLETLKTRLPRQLRPGAELPRARLSTIEYANTKELT